MIIKSLLVGINKYPSPDNLNGCIGDVQKINNYLSSLKKNHTGLLLEEATILTDESATKSNIVNALKDAVENLNSDDVFLFYYSGHGTQQLSAGRFLDDYNGLHQCLVCFTENFNETNYLLADKEIRYLFNLCKSDAHIIAIFDCCHSGDITRSINDGIKAKRISGSFSKRPLEDYIFYDESNFSDFSKKKFNTIYPDANVINLSASLSNESSWEDSQGGVFTRVLLDILNSNNGFINYNELIRQSELTIRLTTREKQTPNIDVLGNRKFSQLTSWLRLNGDDLRVCSDYISYNKNIGWIYTKGSLMGIKPYEEIKIKLENNTYESTFVTQVNLTNSLLENLNEQNFNLDKNKNYAAISSPRLSKPKISIRNFDNDDDTLKDLHKILETLEPKLEITQNNEQSDYDLIIFNQQVYFSFPHQLFKPLNRQFDLLKTNCTSEEIIQELESSLDNDINILTKWFRLNHLSLEENFFEVPIKIEAKLKNSNWVDITQGNLTLEPLQRLSQNHELYNEYQIKITNNSYENLFITVLALINSLHEISAYPFEGRTIMLEPGKSAIFDNVICLDHYQEVYNWESEKVTFKFIVNNHSSLTQEIKSFTQKGFDPPIIHTSPMGQSKGAGTSNKIKSKSKSAIYTSEIKLVNTSENQFTGFLSSNLEDYLNNELTRPYIERLYFNTTKIGLTYEVNLKPNNLNASDTQEIGERSLKMNIGNLIDYTRRNRKFKKLLKKFPKKPIIVAEGDSWFLYPILVKDTLDYIMEGWPLKSLAWAGDTLENYKKSGKLLKYVKKLNPKYVLISGGGNDIIGSDIQQFLKNDVTNAIKPSDYLNNQFKTQIKKLGDYYIYFFTELNKHKSVNKIIVHGYDYIRADHAKIVSKGGWLNKYLENAGIKDYKEREKLIKFLIDEFNNILIKVSNDFDNVTYLDLRGLINKDEWFDEIHPTDEGYKKVADKFIQELN